MTLSLYISYVSLSPLSLYLTISLSLSLPCSLSLSPSLSLSLSLSLSFSLQNCVPLILGEFLSLSIQPHFLLLLLLRHVVAARRHFSLCALNSARLMFRGDSTTLQLPLGVASPAAASNSLATAIASPLNTPPTLGEYNDKGVEK